jgi:hypothetical protein
VFKILQYSEMECNSARKITEGLFRTAYVGKSNNSVKDIIHLGLPKFVGPRLQPIKPMGKSGTG